MKNPYDPSLVPPEWGDGPNWSDALFWGVILFALIIGLTVIIPEALGAGIVILTLL
jgi:hypothetical protein